MLIVLEALLLVGGLAAIAIGFRYGWEAINKFFRREG